MYAKEDSLYLLHWWMG